MMLNCVIMPQNYYDNTWHMLMVKMSLYVLWFLNFKATLEGPLLPTYCENYAVVPSFSSISPYLCKTSCPKHDVELHNYALTITTTIHGMCLWSRYPVLVIIHELGVLTSRPSIAMGCSMTIPLWLCKHLYDSFMFIILMLTLLFIIPLMFTH